MLTVQYAKDPFYNDPENQTVFLTVKFVEMASELPFNATPYDDMDYGRELCANAKNGDYGVVKSWMENPNYMPPSITPNRLINIVVGAEYNQELVGVNAKTPYNIVSVNSLPDGLIITNNFITGVPTVAGNFNCDVKITDALNNEGIVKLSITTTVIVQ